MNRSVHTLKHDATFILKHDHFTLKYGCNMHMHTKTNTHVLALALRYCKDVKLRRAATKRTRDIYASRTSFMVGQLPGRSREKGQNE